MANLILQIIFIQLLSGTLFSREVSILMPNVRPIFEDQYLCHALKTNETNFIVGFKPSANKKLAHHMLLYSCEEPGSNNKLWNCGEMSANKIQSTDISNGPVCNIGYQILFSWAMGASGYTLPKDVSFMIGKNTNRKYLVLQAHYKNVDTFKNNPEKIDASGFILTTQHQPTAKLASTFVLSTDGYIPAKSTVYMETACQYSGPGVLHPFSFRTHTHKLGRLVSGYVIHNNKWTEIGKKSPQEEQMFYPANSGIEVKPGDTLAARCVMTNNLTHNVNIGSTQDDEMCNFYFMFWQNYNEALERERIRAINDCNSAGYPFFSWNSMFSKSEIPDSALTDAQGQKLLENINKDLDKSERQIEKVMADIFGFPPMNEEHNIDKDIY